MVCEKEKGWQDQRVFQLYTVAITSNYGALRRQAMKFLGALERAGNGDAAEAIDCIKKHSNNEIEKR
jgi:hypothetical protein